MANLNLIGSVKEVSEAEELDALIKEVQRGWAIKRDLAEQARRSAAREAAQHDKRKTAGSLGKLALSVSEFDFWENKRAYGDDCWDDKGFIQDYGRLVPGSRIARV